MAVKTTQERERAGLGKVTEVADYLGISRAKTYAMMDAGELAFVKLGKSRRVRWADVERLVNDHLVQA